MPQPVLVHRMTSCRTLSYSTWTIVRDFVVMLPIPTHLCLNAYPSNFGITCLLPTYSHPLTIWDAPRNDINVSWKTCFNLSSLWGCFPMLSWAISQPIGWCSSGMPHWNPCSDAMLYLNDWRLVWGRNWLGCLLLYDGLATEQCHLSIDDVAG